MRTRKENYDLGHAHFVHEIYNLQFEQDYFDEHIEPALKEQNLYQRQFDKVMGLHARHINRLFNASRYSFGARLRIALHFLLGRRL